MVGRNTPEADAEGMGYIGGACCGDKVGDMVRFLRERQRENKGEERGGPLDEAGVRAVASPKEERKEKGKGGSGTGNDGAG